LQEVTNSEPKKSYYLYVRAYHESAKKSVASERTKADNIKENMFTHKNKPVQVWFLSRCSGTGSIFAMDMTLKDLLINRYKNRATVDVSFIVDKARKRPNPSAAARV